MRVLITGGASFIGGNLCARLCADRRIASVTVLDCLTTGRRSNLAGLDIEFMDGSVRDREVVAAAVGNADAVVHLAAQVSVAASADDPVGTHEVNATGTLNVLEAARRAGTAQVIVASSAAVYGDALRSPTDESVPTSPRTIYGSSKLAAEAHALAYGASLGVGTLALRFFNVFGPLQRPDSSYAAVIPAFVSAAVDGRPVTVNGDGAQTRDFVYVGTVCAVIEDAIVRRVCLPHPVNVASGTRTSVTGLAGELEELTGRRVQRVTGSSRPGDVRDSCADTAALRRTFPDVAITPFAEGLAATYHWFTTQRDERMHDERLATATRGAARLRA